MANLYDKRLLAKNAQKVLSSQVNYTGTDIHTFKVEKSARPVFYLTITAITGSLTLEVENSADPNQDFNLAYSHTYSATGAYIIPLTDVQRYFNVSLTSPGTSSYTLSVILAENSTSSVAETLLQEISTKLDGIPVIANPLPVSDAALQTLATTSNTVLNSILTQLSSGTLKVDDDQSQVILTDILDQLAAGGLAIGTEDGTPTGTQHVFVNNLRSMILASSNRNRVISYLDIASKKNRRVDKFEYTSATFPGITLVKQFGYTLSSGDYVLTSEVWSLI